MQRSALCRSRRELSNEYLLAKIADTWVSSLFFFYERDCSTLLACLLASIQPRTSPSKFGGKFNSIFIRLLNIHHLTLENEPESCLNGHWTLNNAGKFTMWVPPNSQKCWKLRVRLAAFQESYELSKMFDQDEIPAETATMRTCFSWKWLNKEMTF